MLPCGSHTSNHTCSSSKCKPAPMNALCPNASMKAHKNKNKIMSSMQTHEIKNSWEMEPVRSSWRRGVSVGTPKLPLINSLRPASNSAGKSVDWILGFSELIEILGWLLLVRVRRWKKRRRFCVESKKSLLPLIMKRGNSVELLCWMELKA